MKGTLNPVFANHIAARGLTKAIAEEARDKLTEQLTWGHPPETTGVSTSSLAATIHSNKLDRTLFTMGLAGAVTGCLAGFLGLTNVPGREAMYLVMLPLGGAFTGMALSFLGVIGCNQFARWQETPGSKLYLGDESRGRIEAIFASHEDGGNALQALINAGVGPGKISVIGEDSDSFRQATASLQSKKINRNILYMGVIGGVVGSMAGLAGMPALTHVASPLLSAVSAVMVGLVLGVYTGVAIGGMMYLDAIPSSDANFQLGTLDQGEMAVSVVTSDENKRQFVKDLLSEHALPSRLAVKD